MQFELASSRYTEALEAGGGADASQRAVLLCNRSAARRFLRDLPGALEDATAALDISPTYRKAAFRAAAALFESERYAEALAAFLHLKRLDASFPSLVAWLQRCHVRLARRAETEANFYALLGVPCDCSELQLKHAYRKQSKRMHPDRAAGSAGQDGAAPTASTAAFQSLQRAYDVLRDPASRREYDYGPSSDWELACRARYWPPARFKPFQTQVDNGPASLWDQDC